MRPLTIILLVAAVAAFFVASLTPDGHVALAARLVYCSAFVGSIIAFARLLPRTTDGPPREAMDAVSPTAASAHG